MNRIFVAKKPIFISSNQFLSTLKRKYNTKKGGFSGILDPFATGVLIVAFGQYTKLFSFLSKGKKTYKATLFLGLKSASLDLENVISVTNFKDIPKFDKKQVEAVVNSFLGEVRFTPPKYSAKKINGKKAYELARNGDFETLEANLKEQIMQVYEIKLNAYCHPFISFEVCVSEGGYIRSLGDLIAKKLGTFGSLSYLERLSEGDFIYENEKPLNPLEILPFKKIVINDEKIRNLFLDGKKFSPQLLKICENEKYMVQFSDFFSIITSKNQTLQYLANRIPLC